MKKLNKINLGKVGTFGKIWYKLKQINLTLAEMYSNNTITNYIIYLILDFNNPIEVIKLAQKIYSLKENNVKFITITRNKGETLIDSNFLGYYLEKVFNTNKISVIVPFKDNNKINYKVLLAKVNTAKSLIRKYSDQEYNRYYKYISDYKIASIPEEADGLDIIQYKSYMDRDIQINFIMPKEAGKYSYYLLNKIINKYNINYSINNIVYKEKTNSVVIDAEEEHIQNLYIRYFNVSEYDEDRFFIKLMKRAYEEKDVKTIKDFMSFNLRYDDFRIDMETLGFQTEEINFIGQILMEDLRFVDQIEVFYEDSEPESEEE